ncbi:MAG: hypothetical protein AB1665_00140 [Candidatus Thermoplasmatota archaeon]
MQEPDLEVTELNFACAGCGATLHYAAGTSILRCPHCGMEQGIKSEGTIAEHPIEELPTPYTAEHGFGIEARHFRCDRCGAVTSLPGTLMAAQCAFCDSPVVVDTPPLPGMVMPESLVPFGVSREGAVQLFEGWLRGLWFRPSDLKRRAALAQIDGIYAPYFTFDASAFSRWSGWAGHYYYVTEHYVTYEGGRAVQRSRQVRKVRWEHRSGAHCAFYDDLLINASRGLPEEILRKIYPYHLSGLVPYRPEFLSGLRAEAYSVDPKDCWQSARAEMYRREGSACSALLDGDTQQGLEVHTEFKDVKWKHLLLPAYISSYAYGKKVYRFMVNGQTGEVQGEAPYSWGKILCLLGALALSAVIAARLLGLF